MKSKYYRICFIVLCVICLNSVEMQAHARQQIGTQRGTVGLVINYYKYDMQAGRYVIENNKTEVRYFNRGEFYRFQAVSDAGYEVIDMRINKRSSTNGPEVILIMNSTTYVDVYQYPLPTYEQQYWYYLYDPATERENLVDTYVDRIQKGRSYTTSMRTGMNANTHIEKVFLNGEQRTNNGNFSYAVYGHNLIKVYWYPNRTFLKFHSEGGNGSMKDQTLYYGFQNRIAKNQFTKIGHRFAGWKGTVEGAEKMFLDEEKIQTPFSTDGKVIDLYAMWEAIFERLFLEYRDEENSDKVIKEGGYKASENVTLWDEFPKEETLEKQQETTRKLIGWGTSNNKRKVIFLPGEVMTAWDLFERASEKENIVADTEVTILLYSIWDYGPQITASKLYLSESDVKEGKITKEFLKGTIKVKDEEDENPAFEILDFSEEELMTKRGGDRFSFMVKATDNVGNISMQKVEGEIISTRPLKITQKRHVRFISEEALETLASNSVWRVKEEYRSKLMAILMN